MPLILAIDCAMRWLNLGLSDGGALIGAEAVNSDTRQSGLLPGAVDDFLSRRGVSLGDLGVIAVTTGPGYYTGIRVGLSYASSLAESL
ncbi:MAG: tRNA (adenosine(37)-N6)-threonylcarbamoyltransferase complex dimerization subunit type 1 TsaB, partial [Synergistaceae bacterium]|nr:tRNA (adenosine(37)-N6)-threonylcarbamoyltransferase complex dimerization subunit type 1 TsaB [Synergistaceae bacterium]